ncbi:MAG: hypothetical protein NVS2B6_19710 [Thermoleophilaceae bacterium]
MDASTVIATVAVRLAARYGRLAPIVRRAGHVYPVAVEPLRGATLDSLVVEEPEPAPVDARLLAAGQPHVRALGGKGRELVDAAVLALAEVAGGKVRTRR